MAPELTKAQKRKSTTDSSPKTKRPKKSETLAPEAVVSKAAKEEKLKVAKKVPEEKKAPKEKAAKKEEQLEVKETKAPKEKKAAKENKISKDTIALLEEHEQGKEKLGVKQKKATKEKKAPKEKKVPKDSIALLEEHLQEEEEAPTTHKSATKEGKKAKKDKKEKPAPKVPAKRAITPDSASEVEIVTEKAPKAKKTKVAAPEGTKNTKKSKKEKVVEEVVEEELDLGSDLEDDQTAALLAGFESSGDEDAEQVDGEADGEGLELEHLPDAPTSDAVKKALKEAGESGGAPGVIYVGRIPHGFYEHQMKAYFSQFGHIKRLRLSRNKRTGKSKHYAFIEFASADVADIVARTMNNYLLFQRILQVRVVPSSQIHEDLWKGAGKRFNKPAPRNAMFRKELEHGTERKHWENRVEKEEKKRLGKAEKAKSVFGYEFEAPKVRTVESVPVRAKAVEAA